MITAPLSPRSRRLLRLLHIWQVYLKKIAWHPILEEHNLDLVDRVSARLREITSHMSVVIIACFVWQYTVVRRRLVLHRITERLL